MRKRKKLEVSTFPFLAVLLCTMGSLILLLLVMDKKAKKAALEKAYAETWNQSLKNQAKTDVEKNEWVKKKSEEHDNLLKKESALEKELSLLKNELTKLEKINEQYKSSTHSEELIKKEMELSKEKYLIDTLTKKLETEKRIAEKNIKDAKILTEKIATMELILKELKASIDKDKFAYSIVPYFGKNGLNRKPLYIECNENGVLLFPDKMLFPSNDESENLKNELLTRTSQLRDYLLQTLGPKDATPYLMILVRPGGITNYWKLQSVIKPMEIDFGYELVDKIWSLEIPTEQSAPSPSKLASLVKPTQIPKPIPAPGNIRGEINNGNGSIPQQNNAAENNGIYQSGNDKTYDSKENSKSISYGATAQNIRPLTALPGFPGNKESLNNLAINNQIIGTNTKGSGLANNNLYGSGMTKNNSNGSGLQNNATDEPRNPTDRNLNESYGNNKKSNNSSDSTNSRNGNSLDNESKVQLNEQNNEKENSLTISNGRNFGNPNRNDLNRTDKESSGGSYSANTKNNESGGASDTKGSYSASTKPNSFSEKPLNYQKGNGLGSTGDEKESSNKKNLSGNPGAQDTEPNSTSKKETTNSIGGSNNQNTQTPIQNQNISISLNNKNKDEANVTTKQMTPRTTYNREDESQSQSDAQDATARIAAPLPELGPRKTQNPTPLRAARLFADRDWVIFVECKFEEILVHPNRLVIPTSLLASEEGVKRFVQEIEKIIQRKQSTVRPGEPPYRPEVRFLVWPDGLKPYHLSYPALQMAGIKQKRQNLEPEDNIKEIIQGR